MRGEFDKQLILQFFVQLDSYNNYCGHIFDCISFWLWKLVYSIANYLCFQSFVKEKSLHGRNKQIKCEPNRGLKEFIHIIQLKICFIFRSLRAFETGLHYFIKDLKVKYVTWTGDEIYKFGLEVYPEAAEKIHEMFNYENQIGLRSFTTIYLKSSFYLFILLIHFFSCL